MPQSSGGSVLLIGNGPNYFSAAHGWSDVVRLAAKHARLQNEVERLIAEPLPIVYERIATQDPSNERDARIALAEQMRALRHNEVHEQLMALNWRTILTTNYDYCLEMASGERFATANLAGETTYSVFRRRRSKERSVWHIHGELSGPRTMMLGLDHYVGYSQKLRRYLTTKAEGSPFVFGTPENNIEDTRHSWADLFLRDDVHIVGLGLGYAEVVLWWLISYKQRLKCRKKLPCGKTTYYHLGNIQADDKGRLELMQGLGVKIEHIPSRSGTPTRATWQKVVGMLKKSSRVQ